jgi:hypothetical protein
VQRKRTLGRLSEAPLRTKVDTVARPPAADMGRQTRYANIRPHSNFAGDENGRVASTTNITN